MVFPSASAVGLSFKTPHSADSDCDAAFGHGCGQRKENAQGIPGHMAAWKVMSQQGDAIAAALRP
jgi:hypothetical protein